MLRNIPFALVVNIWKSLSTYVVNLNCINTPKTYHNEKVQDTKVFSAFYVLNCI